MFCAGFEIDEEILVDEDKIYQIIRARYTGKQTDADGFELAFGKINLARRSPELLRLLERTRAVYSERLKGKALAGADASEEQKMIARIDEFLAKAKEDGR